MISDSVPVNADVRRVMYLTSLIIFAVAVIALLGHSVWRMSQRSTAVQRRAAAVFAGRERLTTTEFCELFPVADRSIAARVRDILKDVLIVDTRFIRPEDRLIADLGLGQVDGLDAYHLDGDFKSVYHASVLPLFEGIGDPSIADVVRYLADKKTTNNDMHGRTACGVCRMENQPSVPRDV